MDVAADTDGLLRSIESDAFDARFCLASGQRSFFRVLHRDPVVAALAQRAAAPEVRDRVTARIIAMTEMGPGAGDVFEHPRDIALAALLYALRGYAEQKDAAARVRDRVRNGHYATIAARRIGREEAV